jgi:hypothetical protein
MFILFGGQLVNTTYIVTIKKKDTLYDSQKYLSLECVLADEEVIIEGYEHSQKEERHKRFEALGLLLEISPLDLGEFVGVVEEDDDCASE